MLSEQIICGLFTPPAEGGSTSGEANISILDLHTYSTISTFKRSSSTVNCLDVSPTHIFAAQSDKATINVYNRAQLKQEATIAFPEKLTALASSRNGGLVASGTDSGRLNVWETASGRYTSTDSAHLQKVTIITFDFTGNLILTGAADSNVLVWSVPHLTDPNSDKKPLRTLQHHQAEVTGIVCGKGSGPAGIAITTAKDSSAVVWNPLDGTLLRTFVFPLSPLCIALDPADRAFYVGFEDGSIQQIDFSKTNKEIDLAVSATAAADTTTTYANPLFAKEYRSVPITAPNARWLAEGHDSSVTSLGVMFEGNYLIAGNAKGTVTIWDVATGHLFKTLTQYKSAISSIKILSPSGFTTQTSLSTTRQSTVVVPRYHNVVKASASATDGTLPPLTLEFVGVLNSSSFEDPFSVSSDFAAVERGATAFRTTDASIMLTDVRGSAADKQKIEKLETDLAKMHENYQRLSDIHKKTWEEHAKWRLEVEDESKDKSDESRN